MDPTRESQLLDPSSAIATFTRQKAEAIRLAREQAAAVREMCRRAKTEVPPYEFEELIGKGAYGRVYKGRKLPSRELVAIKVMEIDSADYKTIRDMKDESIKDFIHEIKVMNQAKQAGAKNVNMLIEAISIHSQLWVVCEHCPGGSVKTLMRATGDRLEERFIIPIARELAIGLKAIHDAGIIHRDVKAANVLIHEEGRLQICDFGVAGILQSHLDKRSTWIGTPHWMPPEMFRGGEAHQYGSELDVWAYGCTLFEIATGNPPNANLRERIQIGRSLGRNTPRLEGDRFSDQLKDLVAFSLTSDPTARPNMAQILEHPYVANTTESHPTSSLSELVRIYYQWTQRGGQRFSLFHPGGAAGAKMPDAPIDEEEWNFSTTDGFERRFSILDLDQLSASLAELEKEQASLTARPGPGAGDDGPMKEMTPIERLNFDERVKRGAAAMEGLFDESKPTYKYETKKDFVPIEEKMQASDLPLREATDRSSVASTSVDINLGAFDSAHYAAGSAANHPFNLADADTIRASQSFARSRSNSSDFHSFVDDEEETFRPSGPRPPTMDWKFPTMIPDERPAEPDARDETPTFLPQEEKRATRDWKFPVMTPDGGDESTLREDTAQTIRPTPLQTQARSHTQDGSRPSTAASSVSTTSDYDPFRFDRPPSPPTATRSVNVLPDLRESHEYADYGSSVLLDGPGPDQEEETSWEEQQRSEVEPSPAPLTSVRLGLAETSSGPSSPDGTGPGTAERHPSPPPTARHVPPFPEVHPPSAEALMVGADDSVVVGELDRLLDDFLKGVNATITAVDEVDLQTRPGKVPS